MPHRLAVPFVVTHRTGKRSRAGRPFVGSSVRCRVRRCGLVAVCKDFCLVGETFPELAGVAGKTYRVSLLARPLGANQFAAVLSGSARPHRDWLPRKRPPINRCFARRASRCCCWSSVVALNEDGLRGGRCRADAKADCGDLPAAPADHTSLADTRSDSPYLRDRKILARSSKSWMHWPTLTRSWCA